MLSFANLLPPGCLPRPHYPLLGFVEQLHQSVRLITLSRFPRSGDRDIGGDLVGGKVTKYPINGLAVTTA